MKNLIIVVLIMLATAASLTGCVTNSEKKAAWNYESGRVIATEDARLLVVQSKDVTELELRPELETVDEILSVLRPQAIWLTVTDKTEITGVEVGDEVRIKIEGEVSESYPAQALASKVEKVEPS